MSFCKQCGYEIKWRTIEGKRVPMGCACDYGEFGQSQFLRDFAVETTCPKCGDRVFFVRHNRGSVWFDFLGEPWLKHPCFDDPDDGDGRGNSQSGQMGAPSGPMQKPGIGSGTGKRALILKLEETDLGQRVLFVSVDDDAVACLPDPGFWSHEPKPEVGQRVLLDRKKSSIELLPSKAEYRCWTIGVGRCIDCGRLYLNYLVHRELCAAGTKSNAET